MHDLIEPVDYRFTVTPRGSAPIDVGPLCELELVEALGEPFMLVVLLATGDLFFEVDVLVGCAFELELGRGAELRTLVGVVLRAESAGATDDVLLVEIEAGPVIAPLELTLRSRVFRNKTAIDIVREIVGPTLVAADGALDVSRLAWHGVVRDHCVQYRESDLAFATRLLAEEGITYVIEGTTMILLDRVDALAAAGRSHEAAVEPVTWVPVVPARAEEARVESVQSLHRNRTLARNRFRTSAWNWKSSTPSVLVHTQGENEGSLLELPGAWHDERRLYEADDGNGPAIDEGAARLARRVEYERARAILVRGQSNHTGFAPARSWELAEHPHRELDGEYVIVTVTHRGVCPRPGAPRNDEPPPRYTNEFTALPRSCPYRPAVPPKPRIHGIQTAIVVGPLPPPDPNAESSASLPTHVHTDEQGRVLLRHTWDESGEDTVWVRVAETSEFAFSTPRIGTEVVVAFIDGDPDQPLVVGVVHNGERRHPVARPEHATRMGWKTLSSPSGDGYNEISLEDADGSEEIHVHAQRDLNARIGRNETRRVGVDRTDTVGRDEKRSVGGNRDTFIDQHDFTHIKGTHTLFVDGQIDANGKRGSLTNVDRGPYIVKATDEIRLECGESKIVMKPDGIQIHAPSIHIMCTQMPPEAHYQASVHVHPHGVRTLGDEVRSYSRGATLALGRDSLVADGGPLLLENRAVLTLNGDARLEAMCKAEEKPPSGVVSLHAKTETHVSADERVWVIGNSTDVEARDTMNVKSRGDMRIEAAAPLVIKGKPIRINCPE